MTRTDERERDTSGVSCLCSEDIALKIQLFSFHCVLLPFTPSLSDQNGVNFVTIRQKKTAFFTLKAGITHTN